MNFEQIIKKAKSNDNENLRFELKELKKIDDNGKIKFDPLLKYIVGFANRDGGYLVLGISDDGSPEGKNIFNKYSRGSKSGVDKIKEKILNKCGDKISPVINIDIEYYENDEYEILVIIIPKRSFIPHAVVKRAGSKIKYRKYYIKTPHSCQLVSDTQLEWLFNKRNKNTDIENIKIHITTHKELSGIPSSFGESIIMQPIVANYIMFYIHALSDEAFDKCKDDIKYRRDILSEILMYSIIQTSEGRTRVVGKKARELPLPDESFKLFSAIKGNEEELFKKFDRKITFPPNSELEMLKNEKGNAVFIIKNNYIQLSLELINYQWSVGLSSSNPFGEIFLSNHGIEGQSFLQEKFESHCYILKSKTQLYFPDVIDSEYYETYDFVENFIERIRSMWDIDHFMDNYPHYKKLYSIEYKLDLILGKDK